MNEAGTTCHRECEGATKGVPTIMSLTRLTACRLDPKSVL